MNSHVLVRGNYLPSLGLGVDVNVTSCMVVVVEMGGLMDRW